MALYIGGKPAGSSIMSAVVLCIWSFIGVESASVNTAVVENPKRNIPLSTLIGTALAGIVYILSCTAISGMFPAKQMAASGAPFSLAMGHICAGLPLAYLIPDVVSAVTAFACLASLGSWIMLLSNAGCRAAADGTLPPIFGRKNAKGQPVAGLLLSACMMSAMMLLMMMLVSRSGDTQDVFDSVTSIAVLLTLPAYFYSALALLKRYGLRNRAGWLKVAASLGACLFCLIAFAGAEKNALAGAVIVMLGAFIFYVGKPRPAIRG